MRVPLISGPYQARSLIASAQRSINLFPESNQGDPQAPVPVTQYPTPGLVRFSESATIRTIRQLYRATNGSLYAVIGPDVYYIDSAGVQTLLGSIADQQTTCYFADNGLAIVLVDGTTSGYAIDMATNAFAPIVDPNFLGADFVIYFDTYFVFNEPNSNRFYISLSFVNYALLTAGVSFDPLDIVAKSGQADNIVGIVASQPYFLLVGSLSSEAWYNTGAADFTFGRVQGTFIAHGCIAPYSIAAQDIYAFWLSQDLQGTSVIVRAKGAVVERISTHAIEAEINKFGVKHDAIGMCYQQEGHAFYICTFPTEQKTYVFELATQQWHERAYIDNDGTLKRHRMNCSAYAYEKNLVGDWQNGRIYELDPNVGTDDGNPILRLRTFPHMIKNGQRVIYTSFIIDIQTGTITDDTDPMISLRWSDDKGVTFGNAVMQSMGSVGEYISQVSYNRLGMARDRIFEISWSTPNKTALNGAFVEMTPCKT
jgi:hypothetical protein